jgi:hypothetical protein
MTARRPMLLLIVALGCGHSEPFSTAPREPLGPAVSTLPRRLTFNTRSDITPSVAGDTIVYSRSDANRADGDRCLAFLPLEGGTLYRTACARGALADSVRDSWLYAAVSPDGRRVAFVRERLLYRAGNLLERSLVVAPLEAPDSAQVVVGGYELPGGGIGSGYRDLTWRDDLTLRFLGGVEVAGGGAVDGFESHGVFEVAPGGDAVGMPTAVPELADATAYAPGDDGALYFVPRDSTAVYRLAGGAPAEAAVRFSGVGGAVLIGLTDVAVSGGVVAVIGIVVFPESGPVPQLLVANLSAGTPPSVVPLVVPPERLAGVPGSGRVVVESRGDLWLVAIR